MDTVFYGASLSKAVSAVWAMMLVEDGIINLDNPLVTYLENPVYTYEQQGERAGTGAVRHQDADAAAVQVHAGQLMSHEIAYLVVGQHRRDAAETRGREMLLDWFADDARHGTNLRCPVRQGKRGCNRRQLVDGRSHERPA